MIQNKYAIVFLVSNLKFFGNMLRFFPNKGLEDSIIYLVVDDRWQKDLKGNVLLELENNLFFKSKVEYIFTTKEILKFYVSYFNLQKFDVLKYSLTIFQIILNDFFTNVLDYFRVLMLDDDIFVLDDLEYLLKREEEFLFVIDNFNALKYDVLIKEYNEIFEINLDKEYYKKNKMSMGTVVLSQDKEYKKYLKRILESDYLGYICRNRDKYGLKTQSWLFGLWSMVPYVYILKKKNRNIKVLNLKESRIKIIYGRKEKMYFLKDNMKINKAIYHYACGKSKDFFVDNFSKILEKRGYLNA